MWTGNTFVICNRIRIRARFRTSKTSLNYSSPCSFPTDRYKAVPLLQLVLLCACDFICDVCFVLLCPSSFLPLMSREGELFVLWPLRKHAYSTILKILPQKKKEIFQIKNSDMFHISAQNIDCEYSLEPPRRGGSNDYPQSMF